MFFLLISTNVLAQYSIEGFDLDEGIRQWYDTRLGEEKSGILNGEYVQIQRQSRDSHQFFDKDQWLLNSITYRGQTYDSVYMRYDIERDLVLIRHPTNFRYHSQAIKLIQSDIASFELEGHHFRRYDEGILNFSSGFFDELYLGAELKLLAKRIKTTETNQTLNYVSEDKLILVNGNEHIRLKGKGSVLRAFKPDKQAIKAFIKDNNLDINPDNEYDYVTLIRFIDNLTASNQP
ncbi:MAG: hypothetical protein RIC35_00660 [Marinoscillum sp.]